MAEPRFESIVTLLTVPRQAQNLNVAYRRFALQRAAVG
jgi:hypothetical protein